MDLSPIKTQREEFAKKASSYTKTVNSDNNAFGGLIFNDGSLQVIGRWACHGWLSEYHMGNFTGQGSSTLKYVLSAVMCPRNGDKNKLLNFTDWLINRSVWKDVFLEKDASQVLTLGHVVDPNQPANFIASAMMASRFLTEVYVSGMERREIVYYELLRLGLSEDESFFFAHMYAPTGTKGVYPISFNRLSSGHSTFLSSGFELEYAKNFLLGKPRESKFNKPLSKGLGYTNGTINIIWGETHTSDGFGKIGKSLKPKRVVIAKDHHIFRKVASESYVYNSAEDFLDVLQQMKEVVYA